MTKEKGNLNQLVVQSNKFVIGLVGSKEIVVWDLTRGVVSSSVVATAEQDFLDLATGESQHR